MKIAFPLVNEKELAIDFIHSNYIGIYDDAESKTDFIPLPAVDKRINANIFFDTISSKGLKSVVCPHYSFLSLRIFQENNIETLKAISMNLDENIYHLKNRSLKPFNTQDSGLVNGCAGGCTTCNTSCSGN